MAIENDGRYKAKACGDVVLGTSAKKGTPFIELYFEIQEGENKGGKVRWTSYFGDNSSERTIESLQHCGWSGDDVGEFADGQLHGLDANDVEIVTELEEYEKEGEKKVAPRVKWVNKIGGYLNVQNAMAPEAAASFGEKMKGLVLKMKQKKGDPAAADDFPHGANAPEEKATGTGTKRKSF